MAGRYDRLGLYHDAGDPRLIVPKRVRAMGWTINLGHPLGPALMVATGAAVAATIAGAVLLR